MNTKNLKLGDIASYSIDQLDFIIRNNHSHSEVLVKSAEERLLLKLEEWRNNNLQKVFELDKYIRQKGWYDFQVWSYDAWNLVIGGSYDLSYHHSLEITFSGTFFFFGFCQTWQSDTDKTVIEMIQGDLEKELNQKYEIEQYHQLFMIRTEGYKNDIIIASRDISYETKPDKMLRKVKKLFNYCVKSKYFS